MSAEEIPDDDTHPRAPSRHKTRRHRTMGWFRWLLLGVGTVVAVVGAFGYLLYRDAASARDSLTAAMDEIPTARAALADGDVSAAQESLARIQPLTASARSHTDGPLWSLGAKLPVIGPDLEAVTTAAAVVDDLSHDVLPPLADIAGTATSAELLESGDGIALQPLIDAAPKAAEAARAVDSAQARLAGIDPTRLHEEVAGPFAKVVNGTDEVVSVAHTAQRLTALAPVMLGSDGPRLYLVAALNNAELRATGGIPGAFAVISVDDGRVALASQATALDVGPFEKPVLPLTEADQELYTDRLGRFVQDTTLTPDYPTTAALMATMWRDAKGQSVDGVIATDPIALSYLLKATGPVEVEGKAITGDNAVEQLLSTAYAERGSKTDGFFSAVAANVLRAVVDGKADSGAARQALDRAATEHRLLMWSAHPEEQEQLVDTVVSGALNTAPRAASSIGVFYNDATGGKMDYYFGSKVRVTDTTCTGAGRKDQFDMDLSSRAPGDAATSLHPYVTGQEVGIVQPGFMRTIVVLYAARGGEISDVLINGRSVPTQTADENGRQVRTFTQDLAPGQTARLTFTALTPTVDGGGVAAAQLASSTGKLDFWTTPTTTMPGLRTFDVAACESGD